MICKIPIPNSKKRNGILAFDLDVLYQIPQFILHEKTVLTIPSFQWGGNHRHPRQEAFIAFNDGLELHWLDDKQVLHKENMKEQDQYYLFMVPAMIPHVIVNPTQSFAVLIEFADQQQQHVEPVILFNDFR